jgi:hypothetical protein
MVRALGWIGVFGAALAILAVLGLDATVGGQHTRGRELRAATISEYVYTSGGPVFVAAVLILAGGSAALLYGLIRAGRVPLWSAGSASMALWVVALLAIVAFPKHNWVTGPSLSRHRASLRDSGRVRRASGGGAADRPWAGQSRPGGSVAHRRRNRLAVSVVRRYRGRSGDGSTVVDADPDRRGGTRNRRIRGRRADRGRGVAGSPYQACT